MSMYRRAAVWGILLTSAVVSTRADWVTSNVETGTNVGFAVSLAIDTAGFPHISYYRPTVGFEATFSDLTYATRTGNTWATEPIVVGIMNGTQGATTSIAVTELGNPAVSFTRSSTFVRYSIRSMGSWMSPIDVSNAGGGYSSLVWGGSEAAATPKVAFNDSAANDLRFAAMNAGTFMSQALDTDIAGGAYCSMAQVGSYIGVAYIDGSKLGFWQSLSDGMTWGAYSSNAFAPFTNTQALICSLALAPTKNNTLTPTAISAHILYFDNMSSSYKYITNDTDTGTWAVPETVFASGLVTLTQYGCSIVVDSEGVIHAAFLDYSSRKLGYAKRTAGGWSAAEFPEGAALGGAFCNIRLGAGGRPAIAHAGLVFDAGAMSYVTNAVRFAEFTLPSNPGGGGGGGGGALTFAITGKSKRATDKTSLVVKGTASPSATSVEWRVGKGKFRVKAVSAGKWSIKVNKLALGKNVVEFRAKNAQGLLTGKKKLQIVRR